MGAAPNDEELNSYLEAYFGDRLGEVQRTLAISNLRQTQEKGRRSAWLDDIGLFFNGLFAADDSIVGRNSTEAALMVEASNIVSLLDKSTEEMDSVLEGLSGGFVKPAPGGGTFSCTYLKSVYFRFSY